jgi:hypothetical protein
MEIVDGTVLFVVASGVYNWSINHYQIYTPSILTPLYRDIKYTAFSSTDILKQKSQFYRYHYEEI